MSGASGGGQADMLARLIAQADGGGGSARPGGGVDMIMIRALVEEASALGTQRALERLGLADEEAEADMRELRQLLVAWRDAKKAARGAVIGWAVRACMALLLLGLAVRLGLFDLVRG